jgi:hypothetical protein
MRMDSRFGLRIAVAHLLIDLALLGVFVWNGWQAAQEQKRAGGVAVLWAQEGVSFDPWVMDAPPIPFQLIQMGTLPVGWVELAIWPKAHWQTPGRLLQWQWALCHLLLAGGFWWGLASFRTAHRGWHQRFICLRLAGFLVLFSVAMGRAVLVAEGFAWIALGVWAGSYWLRFAARRRPTSWGQPGLQS